MQNGTEFVIKDASVICPACEYAFATPSLHTMPNLTADSPVEADLHRILPDPAARGALIAVCPACTYAWWISAFATHHFVPELLVPAPPVEHSKKFGVAIVSGRKQKEPLLDMALLAMNGYWCAREEVAAGAGNPSEISRWLKLAVKELKAAMKDESWQANTSRYNYLLGELLRQSGEFHQAVSHLQAVDRRSLLPKELVDHQIAEAKAGNAEPVMLPPRMVDQVFRLSPPVIELPEPEPTPISA
ncbi:MAG TPA: hypothetical protein V6C97_34735 [Oculatellaceae cyanobacterium]